MQVQKHLQAEWEVTKMVQFFERGPSRGALQGQLLGEGIGQVAGMLGGQQYKRGQLQKALAGLKNLPNQQNATPFDVASELISSTAGIPGAERYVGQLFEPLMRQIQINRSQQADYGQGSAQNNSQIVDRAREFLDANQPSQKQNLPEFLGKAKDENQKFFPSNVGANEYPGNLAQSSTAGGKRPIKDSNQLMTAGKDISKQLNIPVNEGYTIAKSINDEDKVFNQQVDLDVAARKQSQRDYGNLAVEKLGKVLPDATDEQQAFFKRKIEEEAGKSESEANIERYISKEASKFKNMMTAVDKDIPASRAYNKPLQKLLGNEKSAVQARDDMRVKLKPLLDDGLYDTARNLLSKKGYYPEERESIVTDLGEGAKRGLAEMPQIRKFTKITPFPSSPLIEQEPVTEFQQQIIRDGLKNIFNKDPSSNLILLRKAFEDQKNVGWRDFKDSLNELLLNGDIKLNDDQFNQLKELDTPPLNNLDKILHGLNLIGR